MNQREIDEHDMLQIFDTEYSSLQPVLPKKNAVAVFNIDSARIALEYDLIDFVIALNEKTNQFAYCYNLYECEKFLE